MRHKNGYSYKKEQMKERYKISYGLHTNLSKILFQLCGCIKTTTFRYITAVTGM
jgi:hypothetical protein